METLKKQQVDFAIASGNEDLGPDIVKIPCYQWDRLILFPHEHELGDLVKITLEDVTKYPLVGYHVGEKERSSFVSTCENNGLEPNIIFTARDADVIKTYVRLGLGIGLIAGMAYDEQLDHDLVKIDASHLFATSVTSLGFRKGTFLRGYMHDFIHELAPHLGRELVQEALSRAKLVDRVALYEGIELPEH